ncbi:hypothetical protein [Nocardiopsis sp. LOL_012]|uniref:hypothetical protein n=1 Tax=Nocardiopsis sp. LOL_012 TaxID=3345409 RepID=UPI003A8A1046
MFETREVEFDETWRDTASLLGRPALRGRRGNAANELLAPLLEEIEGAVLEENGRFYVQLPSGTTGMGKIEAHLVSEGFRKLAMIIRLVSNGVLLEGGYLFWDEPEANLNSKTQRAVARAILSLVRSGTQVFAARIHMFLLPNNVKRDVLIALLHGNLRDICTRAVERTPGVWRVARAGLEQL